MTQANDLSRSLTALDQNRTLIAVVEVSVKRWLVRGEVPGLERQPMKKLDPDPVLLLRLIERWGEEDARRPSREREALVGERGRITNRVKSALVRFGISGFNPLLRQAAQRMAQLRTPCMRPKRTHQPWPKH
jgi:hypothetical protein